MWNELMLATFWWLKVLGLPLRMTSTKDKFWNAFLLFCLTYSCILVIFAWQNNFDVAVEILDVCLPFFEAIVKRLLIVVKRNEFNEILESLRALQEKQDIVQHPLTKQFYQVSRRSLVLLRITYVSGVFVMMSKTLFSNSKEMPYLIWLPDNWNLQDHWTFVQIVYCVVQSSIAFILILSIAAVDSLYISIVVHLAGHITIINNDFKYMFQTPDNHHSTLVDIVKRQNLTFKCLELMNNVFSFQLLSQLLTIVVTICMGMVIINGRGLFTITTYVQLLMMTSSTMQAFVYCFFGDFISAKLNETNISIYSSEWYLHPQQAKHLILLLQRANRINIFTFGGLLNLDLNTFTLIMKNSFSFYALLNAQKPTE